MAGVGQSATGLQAGSWVLGFFRDGPSAQDPIVLGSIASKVVGKPDKNNGFSDPSGTNPTKTGADIPVETTSGTTTIKTQFISANLSGITTSWTPPSSYIAPSYPANQVIKTRSGHVIEYDDTTGKERISFTHKSGAFIEIDPSGNINICGKAINIRGTTVNLN
jgi:hypothetical protein